MRVFYFGYPGAMGGANTEIAHTLPVWKQAGVDVVCIPTWGADADTERRLTALGVETRHVAENQVESIPDLPGSICVSMCNSRFWPVFPTLKKLGCKTVWSSAMCFEFEDALAVYRHYGLPDVHHFHTEWQRKKITEALGKLGLTPSPCMICGAFDFDQVPFKPRPHAPGEEFWIGRLSRPELDKWSSNLWNILGGVPYEQRRALAMAWSMQVARKCGPPPPWAETHEAQRIPVPNFLGRCHAMLGLNGGAEENWPRIGLEAMAAGVPLVVQNQWGWREQVVHGETGFLCDNDNDFRFYLALLARDEQVRQRIIAQARAHVKKLADPAVIGGQWRELFESLQAGQREEAVAA